MSASLQPVGGDVAELIDLLRPWIADGTEPIRIRTSGSSGRPKTVILSRSAVLASANATHDRLGGPGQWLLALPPTGVAGLQVLIRSLLGGHDPVVAGKHPSLVDALASMSATRRYASLVPTQLHRLDQSGDLSILAGLDALLIGGAAVSSALVARARDAGVNLVRTYGMSETCGGVIYDGVPLDGARIHIADDRQIHLAGDMIFDGYEEPGATTQVMNEGWFATSDLGEFDGDGRLRVLGRNDDVVVSGGVNIALPAVTDALRSVESLNDVCAVAVDDAEWGQRVVAFVVGETSREEMGRALETAGLPRTWTPRQIVNVKEIPLLPGGKVDRLALRKRATN